MFNPCVMLAQAGKPRAQLDEVSREINQTHYNVSWELVLIGLGMLLLAIVLISASRRWKTRNDDPSPMVIYSVISRKSGLGWADQLLLWRIARAQALPTPIALLIARGTLTTHAQAYAAQLRPHSAQRVLKKITRIRNTLFVDNATT